MSERALPMWEKISDNRFVRIDNAVVMWDQRSPYPNPLNPNAKMWTAWEPGESDRALSYTHWHSLFRSPRRYKTATAAMRAVNKEFPFYVFSFPSEVSV